MLAELMSQFARLRVFARISLLAAALLTSACAHATVARVLDDYRGSEEWKRSNAAFKTIIRQYVHGEHGGFTDAELDQLFEDFLTLSQADVDKFLRGQSCVPESGSGPARYYMANVTHQRHDGFFATDQARPLEGTGNGTRTAHATFSANTLLERHEISASSTMPARTKLSGNPFPDWASIQRALSTRSDFDATFKLRDAAQAEQIFAHTQTIDWANSTAELYIAPELIDGKVFSPALFSIYLLRAQAGAPFSAYLVVSANAAGQPQTPYVGLLTTAQSQDYQSFTGFAFTYLSSNGNLLDYAVVVTGENPTAYDMWIRTYYPDHPDSPYLTVRTQVLPAVSEEDVALYKDVKGASTIMLLRKGALMRDLVKTYYPHATDLQLWEDVGALKGDPTFKKRLEAAGLTLAAGLFEPGLWIERPHVQPTRADEQPHYEQRPGMELRCGGPGPR
jgi:hypothetical protein